MMSHHAPTLSMIWLVMLEPKERFEIADRWGDLALHEEKELQIHKNHV